MATSSNKKTEYHTVNIGEKEYKELERRAKEQGHISLRAVIHQLLFPKTPRPLLEIA